MSNPNTILGEKNYKTRADKKENFIKKLFKNSENHTSKTGTNHTAKIRTTSKNRTSKTRTNRTLKIRTYRTSISRTSNINKNYSNSNSLNTKINHHQETKKDDDKCVKSIIKNIYDFGITKNTIEKSTTLFDKAVDSLLAKNSTHFFNFSNDKRKDREACRLNAIYNVFVSALKNLLKTSDEIRTKVNAIISLDTDLSQTYNSALLDFGYEVTRKFFEVSKTTKINSESAYIGAIIKTYQCKY